MPYEAHLTDAELAEYRKQRQKSLVTDMARQQRLQELENNKKQRAAAKIEVIMESVRNQLRKAPPMIVNPAAGVDPLLLKECHLMSNPMLDGKLSTTIPLNSNMVSPGLCPMNVEDLHITKEDVGLKNPIIVKDYPSPKDKQIRYI